MDFLTLTKIFAQDHYAVPDYQREYEWTDAENSTLLLDILELMGTKEMHFIGAIVTIPFEKDNGTQMALNINAYNIDDSKIKHVVDGQQRLTSLSVMIKALHDAINDCTGISDDLKQNLKDILMGLLISKDFDDNFEKAPYLLLNGNTGECFQHGILKRESDGYNKIYKGAKRLLKAYSLYKSEIEKCANEADSMAKFYREITDVVTKQLQFVEIECSASSNAFQVFDSLNGKGLDLTAADRIKNIFLMWSPKGSNGISKWDFLVQSVGDEYLTNFFVSLFFYKKYKRIGKNKLPEEFKKAFSSSAQQDFSFFYNDIKKDALLYGQLRSHTTDSKKLNALIEDAIALGFDQIFVLIFAAAKNYSDIAIGDDQFIQFVKALINLLVRMQVCDKSTNRLDTFFSKCISSMQTESASLSVIITNIKNEQASLVSDEQFEAAFVQFAPTDSKVAEYYLRKIESLRRKQSNNRSETQKGLTVEHIIPRSAIDSLDVWYGSDYDLNLLPPDYRENVIENIGNKSLLFADDNASASNNNYSDKLVVYKTGKKEQQEGTPYDTFQLIHDLVDNYPESFTHVEVVQRAKELAKLAVTIWQ